MKIPFKPKHYNHTKWHKWFAWFPIEISPCQWLWLEHIERMRRWGYISHPWDYRLPRKVSTFPYRKGLTRRNEQNNIDT